MCILTISSIANNAQTAAKLAQMSSGPCTYKWYILCAFKMIVIHITLSILKLICMWLVSLEMRLVYFYSLFYFFLSCQTNEVIAQCIVTLGREYSHACWLPDECRTLCESDFVSSVCRAVYTNIDLCCLAS